MELVTIRTEVRARIGELVADFYTDAEVDRAINEAVTRFCAEERWAFLMTEWSSGLTNNDEELTLPSNVSLTRVFNISISGGNLSRPQMPTRVDPKDGFLLRHQYTDRNAVPLWYYVTRSNLADDEAPPTTYTAKFIPKPDADYDVEAQYMAVPVVLSGPSDEPMVPDEYQEGVIAWAAGKLLLKELGISQKASEQFALYTKVLSQARTDLRSFDLDEIVAWGRREPLRSYWAQTFDPALRTPQNLG